MQKHDSKTEKEKQLLFVTHEFPAIFAPDSRVLLLGSIPSPKSREQKFYYGHPQNRFWRTLSAVLSEPIPDSVASKKAMLLKHRIALWDVLASCWIRGASDSSIEQPVPNDIAALIRASEIKQIFTTGAKAQTLYMKYCFPDTGLSAIQLPSTSPANCRITNEALTEAYRQILPFLTQSESM